MQRSFVFTVDVGNTSTSFGLFPLQKAKGARRPSHFSVFPTYQIKKSLRLRSVLHSFKRRAKLSPLNTKVVVSSVVPTLDQTLKRECQRILARPFFVTGRTPGRVKIRTKKPSEVGPDRLVNARAAMALAKGPAIVIDFGTATTFDCIGPKSDYLGGLIVPGPKISAEALCEKTACIPLIPFTKPHLLIGRTTKGAVQSGLYHGYRGMVSGIVRLLKKKMGRSTRVYMTGGQSPWILKGLKFSFRYLPYLTHLGLYHVAQDKAE